MHLCVQRQQRGLPCLRQCDSLGTQLPYMLTQQQQVLPEQQGQQQQEVEQQQLQRVLLKLQAWHQTCHQC